MPSIKMDPYAAQISSNIFKLTNVSPIPFQIKSVFDLFSQPALIRFFEQHQLLGVDIAPFVFGMLVHVAMMLDGADLFNPDGTGFLTSMNLFIHVIGEPGTNKSGLFKVFYNSIDVLKKIFPDYFSKPVVEIINGTEKTTTVDLIANNETELSLFQRLSKRENVFISTDELDVINTRFGVYLAGAVDNDIKTVGSRLLCQCYHTVKNISRTTGSSSFFIQRGSINIFGASTGNMLSSVCRQYNTNVMSDGTISRYLFVTATAHKASNNIPAQILSVQPNIVHILIVVRLLAQHKPIFVFAQHQSEDERPTLVTIPSDIEEARRYILNPIPTTESVSLLKPSIVTPVKAVDQEQDGSVLSAYAAIRRIIEVEHQKSLQTDVTGSPTYTPLQRAFQRKSSNKLVRLAALCQTISYAIQLCTECINMVRFGDGLYLKESTDNEQLNWLKRFHDKINELIIRDIAKAPKFGNDQRPIFVIEKAAVHASEILFQYNASTINALFDDTSMKNAAESPTNTDSISKAGQLPENNFFEEHSILLRMTSPIILKAWFSNEVTGLPFTNIFLSYRKSNQKTLKLKTAIDKLVESGILIKGLKRERHITAARKETYLKASPTTIRRNLNMLNYLRSINIDIDNYERAYLSSPLPIDLELTAFAVNFVLSNDDYLEFCHLFNNAHIQLKMEERLSKQEIQCRLSFGRRQYYIPSSSQAIGTGDILIQSSQESIAAETSNHINEYNNNRFPTLTVSSRRSLNNSPTITLPLSSRNSSLVSEFNKLNNMNKSENNFSNGEAAESSSDSHHPEQPPLLINDAVNELTDMINRYPLNTGESRTTSTTMQNISAVTDPHGLNMFKTMNYNQGQIQSDLENINSLSNNYACLPAPSASNDILTFLANISSQQTVELMSYLLRDKKDLVKRAYEQEDETSTSKRLKNDQYEEITLPAFDMDFDLNETFFSNLIQMESNKNNNNDNQMGEEDNRNVISGQIFSKQTPSTVSNSMSPPNTAIHAATVNHVTSTTSIIDVLSKDVSNQGSEIQYANESLGNNVNYDMTISSTSLSINSTINESNSNENAIAGSRSNNPQSNSDTSSTESTITNDQEEGTSEQSTTKTTNLAHVYSKLILTNSIIMTKSDICIKLKHIIKTTKLRNNVISTLLQDKLLIQGNWFATKKVDGQISFMPGYLKAFPKDNVQDQQDFARQLTKYGIHFNEFEKSFKKKRTDSFPRTLTTSDINKHNTWLYSTELVDIIQKNDFLRQRITLDPSAVIQPSHGASTQKKRPRKPQKPYSPSTQKQ